MDMSGGSRDLKNEDAWTDYWRHAYGVNVRQREQGPESLLGGASSPSECLSICRSISPDIWLRGF